MEELGFALCFAEIKSYVQPFCGRKEEAFVGFLFCTVLN